MWLPTPNEADVKAFQALVQENLALALDYEQARDAATRLLHIYFYQAYGNRYIRKEVD